MKAHALRCPSCSAQLTVDGSRTRCAYCNADVHVEGGPAGRADAAPLAPGAGGRLRAVLLAVFLGTAALCAAVLLSSQTGRESAPEPFPGMFSEDAAPAVDAGVRCRWDSPRPLVAGDLVIGRLASDARGTLVAAVDPDTSALRWCTALDGIAPDGAAAFDGEALLCLVAEGDGHAVVVSQRDALVLLDARDGGVRWSVGLDATLEDCRATSDELLVALADGGVVAFDLAGGGPGAPRDRASFGAARVLETNAASAARPGVRHHRPAMLEGPLRRDALAGLDLAAVLVGADGSFVLALGGAAAPTLVRLAHGDQSAPEELWRATLPAGGAPRTRVAPGVAPRLDTDGEVVAALVQEEGGGPNAERLVAVTLEEGRELGSRRIPGDAPLHGVVVASGRVYVTTWAALHVFDARTLEPLATVDELLWLPRAAAVSGSSASTR